MGKKWTDKEIEYLKDNYLNKSYKEIAVVLNRSDSSIGKKVFNLGLKKILPKDVSDKNKTTSSVKPRWTNEEIEYLKDNYFIKTNKEISQELGRSYDSVAKKSTRLGLNEGSTSFKKKNNTNSITVKQWTDEEVEYLKDNYNNKSVTQIAKDLNKSVNSVTGKICRVGIKTNKKSLYEQWQIDFILDNFYTMDRKEICDIVNLTETQVYGIARYRGLKVTDIVYNKWTDEEIKIIKDNWAKRDIQCIETLLPNRSRRSIINKASQLGVYCDKTLTNTAKDGIVLNSGEERSLYEFLKFEVGLDIVSIGIQKTFKFYNKEYNENYIPDFIIHNLADKPILVEYYGFLGNVEYDAKINRKNKFYKSLDNYYFISIYPKDLRYKFKGVKEKFTSYIKNN